MDITPGIAALIRKRAAGEDTPVDVPTPGVAALIRQRAGEGQASSAGPSTDDDLPPEAAAPAAPAPAPEKPAATPLRDPAFNDFLAARAKEHADLAAAQGQADKARSWAQLGNSFERARDLFMGQKSDEAGLQARLDEANRPVKNLLERQQVDKAGLADAMGQATLQGELAGESRKATDFARTQAMDDPTSDVSKRARLLAETTGMIKPGQVPDFTASMWQMMKEGASLAEARRQHDLGLERDKQKQAAADQRQDKQLGLEQQRLAEEARHHKAEEGLAGAKVAAGAKQLPARQAERYAETKAAIDQLDSTFQQLSDTGTGLGHSLNEKLNPWSAEDSASRAAVEALIPVVARGLHGGAPSHNEIELAKKFIPQLGDQPAVVKAKYEQLRKTLIDRQKQALQTFGEAGLRVGNVGTNAEEPLPGKQPAAAAPTAHVRFKGQLLEIPRARLAEALADGAEEVQ